MTRDSFRIKATSVNDPSQVHEFESLQAARKALIEWQNKNVGGHLLKKYAIGNREAYGFRWEMVSNISQEFQHPKPNDTMKLESRHVDKRLYKFYDQPVVYMLEFPFQGKVFAKVGWTDDLRVQLETDAINYPGCSIYSAYEIDNPFLVEKEFLDYCGAFSHELTRNSKIIGTIYTGLPIEEFDDKLAELCCEMKTKFRKNSEIEILRLHLEKEKLKLELERLRCEHEIALKKMDLELIKIKNSTSS